MSYLIDPNQSSIFTLENFTQPNILNIFTDASLTKIKQYGSINTIASFGAIAYVGFNIIDMKIRINEHCPVNKAELRAIRIGVDLALKYLYNFQYINIFSDSQISIFALRDRIFSYKQKIDRRNNLDTICTNRYNYPVANQDEIMEIVSMIVLSQIRINFWHMKAHINTNNKKHLQNAEHVFQVSNGVRDKIDFNFLRYISDNNNEIDLRTREFLKANMNQIHNKPALQFLPTEFRYYVRSYKDLVNTTRNKYFVYSPERYNVQKGMIRHNE